MTRKGPRTHVITVDREQLMLADARERLAELVPGAIAVLREVVDSPELSEEERREAREYIRRYEEREER